LQRRGTMSGNIADTLPIEHYGGEVRVTKSVNESRVNSP